MVKRQNEHQHLSDVLKDFVTENNLQKGLDKVSAQEIWMQVMGPAIAGYTTSIRLERNTLFVALSSAVLRQELSYGIEKIIKNLNEALGKELISKLVLR